MARRPEPVGEPSAGLIELGLVFGAVLGFALWELYSLRRDKRRSAAARKAERSGGGSGHC